MSSPPREGSSRISARTRRRDECGGRGSPMLLPDAIHQSWGAIFVIFVAFYINRTGRGIFLRDPSRTYRSKYTLTEHD
mgnify:CR=1 FL=1